MSLRSLRSALSVWKPHPNAPHDPLVALSVAWPTIVGARIAEHSAPLELRGGTLLVGTRSSAWSQQLHLLSSAILERMAGLGLREPIGEVRFKTSPLRRAAGGAREPAGRRPIRAVSVEPPGEAADAGEALERVRRRVTALRRRALARCKTCDAPLEEGLRCAPCEGELNARRRADLERLMYHVPWLEPAEVAALVEGASGAEIEGARRRLLSRWWLVLERARRNARPLSARERQTASSYVLLQSGLPPERITPEIVRNLLGAELESRLAEHAVAQS